MASLGELKRLGYDIEDIIVKCDEENNPLDIQKQRKLVIDIFISNHVLNKIIPIRHIVEEINGL
jgi:hypothetical protein